MADTATSLLSTVLHPARAFTPQSLVRWSDANQLPPSIDLPCHGEASVAAELYAGHFSFAGETVNATPTTIFAATPPSPQWQADLLSLFWLQHFRSSGKVMHARMAARLLEAWGQSGLFPSQAGLAAQALLNLCIHGPHLIDPNVPHATANFQALLRQQLRKLNRLKPINCSDAFHKSAAVLACLLASDAQESTLKNAFIDLADFAGKVIAIDGSHISGNPRASLATLELLVALSKATAARGLQEPVALAEAMIAGLSYLTLLETPQGTLAFSAADLIAGPTLKAMRAARPDLAIDLKLIDPLAENGGHARLSSGDTTVFLQFSVNSTQGLHFALEVWRKGEVSFSCSDSASDDALWRGGMASVFKADGGMLFSLPCLTEQGGRRALSVFLSRDGTDLRIESECAFTDQPPALRLMPSDTGKLSPQQNGIGAVITGGRNQSWQMTSRGAALIRDHHDICLEQDAAHPRMNLAFRLAAAVKRQTRITDTGSLL